jgi:hypothetical protein
VFNQAWQRLFFDNTSARMRRSRPARRAEGARVLSEAPKPPICAGEV